MKSTISFVIAVQALQAVIVLCIALCTSPSRNVMIKDSGCYDRCVDIFHYVLSVLLFLLTPIVIIIGYGVIFATGVSTGPLFSYLTFFAILTVLLQAWFFGSLIDIFERLKQDNTNKLLWKDDQKFLDTLSEKGKVEKSLTLRADMYSLLFVTMVKPEYKTYCDLVAKTGKMMPDEAHEHVATGDEVINETKSKEENRTWFVKFKSFLFFQAPKADRLVTPVIQE